MTEPEKPIELQDQSAELSERKRKIWSLTSQLTAATQGLSLAKVEIFSLNRRNNELTSRLEDAKKRLKGGRKGLRDSQRGARGGWPFRPTTAAVRRRGEVAPRAEVGVDTAAELAAWRASMKSFCGEARAHADRSASLLRQALAGTGVGEDIMKRLEAHAMSPPVMRVEVPAPAASAPADPAPAASAPAASAPTAPAPAPPAAPAPAASAVSAPTGPKRAALLIGINYKGSNAQLSGCINDVNNVKKTLISAYNFEEKDILCLTDDKSGRLNPTSVNIVEGIRWLTKKNREGYKSLWFHYSGHGTHVKDRNRDERDRRDECIVPSDFKLISDDTLLRILVKPLSAATKIVCFMDCCHSGTQIDLRYRYISGNKTRLENQKSNVSAKVVLVSGCRDSQTSDDTRYQTGWAGAMTTHLLACLRESEYNITCYGLLKKLRRKLKMNRHTQVPQMTCSKRIRGSTLFSAKDEPGVTAYISA